MTSQPEGGGTVIDLAGERVVLLPERAAYWERPRTLLVADAHFGKAAAFRAAGVPVPRGTTTGSLNRLDAALARTGAARVVFLGDFLHAREGRDPETTRAVRAWRERHSAVDMVLVRGNHDRRAGDPAPDIPITCLDGPIIERPFVFAHAPTVSGDGYVVCGHIHPAVRLTGPGRETARLPAFVARAGTMILPALGEFTGLADVTIVPGDRVWVVVDGEVAAIPTSEASR